MGKYVQAIKRHGSTTSFIAWKKGEVQAEQISDNMYCFESKAKLGARWRNAFSLLGWNFFVLRHLFAQRRRLSAVHVVDADSAVAAYVFCKLTRKPLIFDIYDHYADTRSITGPVRRVICAIENHIARHADLTLLADTSRYEQHGLQPSDNLVVIENVPNIDDTFMPLQAPPIPPVRLGYFGVLEPRHRGLENLIEAFAGRRDIEVHFAGYGQLAQHIENAATQHDNIFYHGPMPHQQGLTLLSRMHCIAGFYYLSVPNHRFAAPNKYYEHLMLGKPLLTTAGTPPGHKVNADQSGWGLDDTTEALQKWCDSVTAPEIAKRGQCARDIWAQRYQDYNARVIDGIYYQALNQLVSRHA